MTIQQIRSALDAGGKKTSQAQLYRYFTAFKILPRGFRQRPQQYADDTAETILRELGFASEFRAAMPARTKLVTVAQIRAAKPNKAARPTKRMN